MGVDLLDARRPRAAALVLAAVAGFGCDGLSGEGRDPAEGGWVIGWVEPKASAVRSTLTLAAGSEPYVGAIVPGRLLVKTSPECQWQRIAARKREELAAGWVVLEAREARPTVLGTPDLIRLRERTGCRGIEPDRIRQRHAADGRRFAGLGHVNRPSGVGLQGSAVVVAVLDDGVRPHPAFADRLLPGYDMISDPRWAGDGDGRDADPAPTVAPGFPVEFHGMHVAGIVAAMSGSRILPVRVAAPQGARSSDSIAGIAWAAGLDVAGVPRNPHPAQVIQISIGGPGLSAAEQDAVSAAAARGVTVVVSAGNDTRDAGDTSFAGYTDVIAVGALDHTGALAPYSNFGASLDLVAPGGDLRADQDGDGLPDGIESTHLEADARTPGWWAADGTSVAAPHVAGAVALMQGLQPGLSPGAIEQLLRDTAVAVPRCTVCGAGRLNVAAALAAVAPARLATGDLGSPLSVVPERIPFGPVAGAVFFNPTDWFVAWTASSVVADGLFALEVRPDSGLVAPFAGQTIELVTQPGASPLAVLAIRSGDFALTAPVLRGGVPGAPGVLVTAFDVKKTMSAATMSYAEAGHAFALFLPAGEYTLGAGSSPQPTGPTVAVRRGQVSGPVRVEAR